MGDVSISSTYPGVTPDDSTYVAQGNMSPDSTGEEFNNYLDSLGDALSDQQKEDLSKLPDNLEILKDYLEDHANLDEPLPAEVQAAKDYLSANDATWKQITNGGDEHLLDNVTAFYEALLGSAKSAQESWVKYLDRVPTTESDDGESVELDAKAIDPAAKQQAADASLLQAFAPVLDLAGAQAADDDTFNKDDLLAVAGEGNEALPSQLRSAAGFFVSNGEFDAVQRAGVLPYNMPTDTVVNDNLDSYLEYDAPKTQDEFISSLRAASLREAVITMGGDASKVGESYWNHTDQSEQPSAADKAAKLFSLSNTMGKVQGGDEYFSQVFQGGTSAGEHQPGAMAP